MGNFSIKLRLKREENEKHTERGLKYLYNYPNKVSVRDDITTHHQLDWLRRGLVRIRIRITKSPEKTSKKWRMQGKNGFGK
ncbi:hypothetical protein [Fusobacterium varium]|uniref:hypothetical protein n=1 Tax=Fusobacterium varium TaxID=856 RepID=UPI00242A4560|nr:hypothetical protein [Fusobacterium varium]MCF0169260.1 hypothetical protein [Fusobacterium varium]